MNHLTKFARLVDVFSVQFAPSLNVKTKANHFSSAIGGGITIVIYIFIAIYGSRLLQQWITNQMPFKITTLQKQYNDGSISNYFENNKNEITINVTANWNLQEMYYPFDKENIVFIPLQYDVNGHDNFPRSLIQFYDVETDVIKISMDIYSEDHILLFLPCLENQQFLNEKCASQDTVDQLLLLDGLELEIHISLKTFNFYTNTIESSTTYTNIFIQNMFSTLQQINFKISFYDVIKGFFQEKSSQYVLITDFLSFNQMSTTDYLTKYFSFYVPNISKVYAAVYLCSNATVNQINISYPTIAEVLANIGSIMQLLLLIGYLIKHLNQKWMIQEFKEAYQKLFFPQLSKIVKQNVNKSSHYIFEEKKINAKSYKECIKTIDEKINEKMNYQNLIYEISRIQIVLEDITTQYKIISNLIRNATDGEYYIYNYWNQKQILELQPKIYLAPFTLNQSMHKLSEQYCKNLSSDQELSSPQSIAHINPRYLET